MKTEQKIMVLVVILVMLLCTSADSSQLVEGEKTTAAGWSSIDAVFFWQEENLMVKKVGTGPVKIGFTVKEVQEVMGIPDKVDEEEFIFYYHHSPIYFGSNWRVKSWDNRYGNLKVLPEREEVKLGYSIRRVFQEKGFPLSVKKIGHSYQLDYVQQLIYVNERWIVEAVQEKSVAEREKDRTMMSIEDFLSEWEISLGKK